jgi:hypothetical protein
MRGRRFFIKSKSSQLPNNNGSNHVTDNSSLAYQSLKNLVLPEIKTTFPTSTAKRAAFTPEIEALTKDPDLEPEIDMHPAERSPDLRGKSDEEAVELMREWFFENFEDPANNTPYEGEYIYIWGGPYYAEEELRAAFEDTATPEAMSEIRTSSAMVTNGLQAKGGSARSNRRTKSFAPSADYSMHSDAGTKIARSIWRTESLGRLHHFRTDGPRQ